MIKPSYLRYNHHMRREWIAILAFSLLAACAPNTREAAPTPALTAAASSFPNPSAAQNEDPTSQPTSQPSAVTSVCWQAGGVLVEDYVPSELLPEPILVLVYLPPCYLEQPEAHYPALYLIHGQNFTQDQWVRLGAAMVADDLIAAGESAPFLIVMPYVASWSQPGEFPFGQALVEEVLPHIESGFRAIPLRAARAVGGISRGGSWSLHLGTRYWDQFSAFGGHSAPVFLEDAAAILSWLDAIPPDLAPRIYLDIASSEMSNIRRSATWFSEKLEERGIDYQFHEFYGGHNEDLWSAHIEEYLRFYTSDWKP